MDIKTIIRMSGLTQEKFIRGLAMETHTNEADIRRMIESGDEEGLFQLARPHGERLMQNPELMNQARMRGFAAK